MGADASGDDAVAAVLPNVDSDFDLDGLDGFEFDLDLAAASGFLLGDGGGGAGDYFIAAGDEKGEVDPAGLDSPERGGGREGSLDSVVTDDGAVPMASSGDHDGSMSDYVSELERFLMEDDDHEDGGRTMEELADEEYFFGDLLADDGAGSSAAAAEEEEDSPAAAREDEANSRKRARQTRGTDLMPSQELDRGHEEAWHLDRFNASATCSGCSRPTVHLGASTWLST